jgi:spore coat protein U-like protein
MRLRFVRPFSVISAFAVCSSYMCSAAFAQTAVEQGQSQVGVVTPLSFIQTEELHFGQIFASNTAGTVTVAPDGSRTRTGGVTLFGTIHQPAEFAGMGVFNQRVQVSLGSNTIFLTGPGVRMRARTFVIGSTPTAVLTTTPRVFRIGGPTGAFRFPVGATLEVGANQAPGTYRGTWTITLNYQ